MQHPDHLDHGGDGFAAGHRGGAVRVTDDGRLLFICQPRRPEAWVLPVGGHEPRDSFPETARCEVWEETGVDCEVAVVCRAVRKRYVHDDDPARWGYLLEVVFTAWRVGGEAGLYPEPWDGGEDEAVLEVRWFDEPPEGRRNVVVDLRAAPEY